MPPVLGPFSLDRVVRAVELVRQRLLRATSALEQAGIPYAVAGGNAVALWVSRVDVSAVRNTSDVDLLVRRADLAAIQRSLIAAGFVYRHSVSLDMFLDAPTSRDRDGIHLVFAGERVKPTETMVNPDVTESETGGEYRVLSLRALVQIKLTAYRDKDRTHLRDLLELGFIDASWVATYPEELGSRLQALIDTPEG
jgi:hypothetical protein